MIGLLLGALKARSCRELLSTGLGGLDFLGSLFAFPFFLLSVFLAIWFTKRSGRSLYYGVWTQILMRVNEGLALRGLDRPRDGQPLHELLNLLRGSEPEFVCGCLEGGRGVVFDPSFVGFSSDHRVYRD